MSLVTQRHLVDRHGLDELRRPRTDLVLEAPNDDGSFGLVEGPFRTYRRTLDVADGPPGRFEVTERTEFALAIPLWWPLVGILMRRALRNPDHRPRRRWWWPEEVVTQRTSQLVASLCVISVLTGYLGVTIGQTISFAAHDFGRSDSAQANTLAAVRVGVLLSMVLIHRADRIGRRPLILAFATGSIIFTIVGAATPNLELLGLSQTVARGLATGLITLLFLAATEEVPAANRALSISLLTVAAALGAGMVIWVLPLAGVFDGGWRIIYVVPGLFLPVVWWVSRHLPETRRFDAAITRHAPAVIDWRRFALISGAAFATSFYLSPASQLRNEFLRDERGFSAASVSLFQLVVSAPAGVAIVVAGILADRMGRRVVGAVGLAAGASLSALSYQANGPWLWVVSSAAVVLGGAAFPATRGYQTELFPTRARARVGGLIDGVAVAGSASGLVLAGYLSTRWNDLGSAISVLVAAPLVVAVLIITVFPETAATELEAFNPDDPDPDPGPGAVSSGPGDGPDGDGPSRPETLRPAPR